MVPKKKSRAKSKTQKGLSARQRAEILLVYNAYWQHYVQGNVKAMPRLLADDYTQIGSAEGEVFSNKKDAVKFLRDTIDQVAGKVDMRNRVITMESQGSFILVTELTDLFVLIDKDWAFHSKFRASSLLKKTKTGWKFFHQHSSFPDIRAQEGENMSIEKVALENVQLRDAVKRRTVELEQKNRELEIEAALERVRARAMAMHSSSDLPKVVYDMFEQMFSLGFARWGCAIALADEVKQGFDIWISTPASREIPEHYFFEGRGHQVAERLWQAYKEQKPLFFVELRDKEKNEFDKWALNYSGLRHFPDLLKAQIVALNYVQFSYASFRGGLVYSIESSPIAPALQELIQRFARVFEQTYTRFLDLQKAEAQAREAQIQLSLERVRARTMAMQRSSELAETVSVLYEQLLGLGIKLTQIRTCGVVTFRENDAAGEAWTTDTTGKVNPVPYIIRYDEAPVYKAIYAGWKNNKSFLVKHVVGDALIQHLNYLRKSSNMPINDDRVVQNTIEEIYINVLYFSQGYLFIVSYEPMETWHGIFVRFSAVFQQSYTRFLDLQKAEAQAKEALIETALEKVRSRTMAMQKSDELKEVIQVVYDQFIQLNILIEHTGFIIDYRAQDDMHIWLADRHDVPFRVTIPYFDCAHWNSFREAKENGRNFFANHLSFDEKNSFYKELFKLIPGVAEETLQYYFSCPGVAISTVLLENVGLYIENFSAIPYSDEENKTLMRFGMVFQQTYTRFLDLQRAEAQARQAQIESAMERVRARSLAMQKADELRQVAEILRKEMGLLGVEELETSSIYIPDAANGTTQCWYAIKDIRSKDKDLVTDHMTIGLSDTWVGRQMQEFNESDREQTSIVMKGGHRKEWINYCAQHSKVLQGYYDGEIPERTYHLLKFSNGYLGAASPGEISSESWDLLKRATAVFSFAYTRFLDLQKAETQARIAVRQASIDRVRAEIASMRTTGDLEKITPLIWNELTTLGVPFVRCGVFIMNEKTQQVQTFLSTPDGKAILAFHLPYNSNPFVNAIDNWRAKKIHITHWDIAGFSDLADSLVNQGQISNREHYLSTVPKEGLYLHYVPFLQGVLYVGNTQTLNNDNLQLVQSVADAFSTAYARYEDFNKLETAKVQIENTLTNLKQAQAQLVQSEKMASLGELTAGIAHEIQNPLNFVNNFAELNKELLTEMKLEIDKGNFAEAAALAKDIIDNEEKINHHGKRADSIVKGMLQHSRTSSGAKEPTDINALADEYLRLAYHGLRAKDKAFNAKFETDFDKNVGNLNVIPQDIGRVVLNLITNAFYTVSERKKQEPNGYEPTVIVTTKRSGKNIILSVRDNGKGIPQKVLDKIFQPFFTTKPTGQGTGLGLSLSYDIAKAHGGELKVETTEGMGAEFILSLPEK